MGQEILYCSKCQFRIRSSDFEAGKAHRFQNQVFCAACSQEVIRGLPPEAMKEFLDLIAAARGTPKADPQPGPSTIANAPSTAARMAIPPAIRKSSGSPLWIGIAALAAVVLVAILAVRPSSSSPPADPPAADVAARPAESAPPVRTPEERRLEASARALADLRALERTGRLGAEELRLRYAEFAKNYPGTPETRSIAARFKSPEAPAGELQPAPGIVATPKPEAPRTPPEPAPVEPASPVKPAEPVAKPPVPAPAPPPAPEPAPPPIRPPVPETAKLREAEAAFKKSAGLDQAKSPQEKSQLARTLLSTVDAVGAGDADRYIRLRSARDLASAASDLKLALQAIDAMAAVFELDAMGEKAALLTKTQFRGMDSLAWATTCLEVARQASSADDHETAGKLAARAESLAIAAKEGALLADVRERMKEYVELKREGDRLKASLETLKAKPDDPGACTAVGRYLCLIKEDWEKGLPMLAKGGEGPLKKLSEMELAKPTEAAAQAALGDGWAAQGERETSIAKTRSKVRSLQWLDRALPGLSGAAKTSAEKKLSALGASLGSKAPPVLDLGVVRLELIYCRPGVFTMGHSEAPPESWLWENRPPHQVELTRGFFLGKTEVTRGQFAAFVKATGYVTSAEREGGVVGRRSDGSWGEMKGATWKNPISFAPSDDDPVTVVGWNDAKAFCDWLAAKTRRNVRLPTEAEWEYACRAGTTTPWSFGTDPNKFGEYGWLDNRTHPVGQKKPNPWGFFDMHGNAWEWCQDFPAPYKGDARDPEGLPSSEYRIARGGSYDVGNGHCLSGQRFLLGATVRTNTIGFRVAVR